MMISIEALKLWVVNSNLKPRQSKKYLQYIFAWLGEVEGINDAYK